MVVIRAKDNFGNVADLDVLQEAELRCDVSAVESGDIGEVFGISSQEFMLPGTDNNNAFFGNLFNLGAEPSVALNHTVFASVLVDGNEIFSGKMYLNNVLTDQKGYTMYKALVINETIDFKTRIENLYLNELDYTDTEHTLNITNITSSWDGNLASGNIVYPLIDFGVPEGTDISGSATNVMNGAAGAYTFNNEISPLSIADFKPGIKVKHLIDKIFDTVDYQYSSSFFDSAYFDKLFLLSTPNSERGIPQSSPIEYNSRAFFSSSLSQSVADGVTTATVVFPNEKYDNGNAYNPVTGEYTVQAAGDYTISSLISAEWASAPASGDYRELKAHIRVNGTAVKQAVAAVTDADATVLLAKVVNNLEIGDVITITVGNKTTTGYYGSATTGVNMNVVARGLAGETGFTVESKGALLAGDVNFARMFGLEEKVLDFLKGIFQKFNLVMEPKKDERNTLIIEPYNTWVEGGETKDWTDKVDRNTRFSIKGTMVDQAKFVSFKDVEDEDILNEYTQRVYKKTFGEFLYIDQGDLTQGKKEIGTFFAPTPVMAVDGADTTVIPHLYKKEASGEKTPIAWEPRLLHFNGKRDITDIIAYDDTETVVGRGFYLNDPILGTTELITQYGSFHYLEIDTDSVGADFETARDLNWNNRSQVHFASPAFRDEYFVKRDAIWEYWSFYLNSLYDPESKMLTCNVFFTPDELKDLQLKDKIFIDGQYYRINNIKSFDLTKDASVEVELIRRPVRQFQFPRRRVYDDTTSGGTGAGSGGTFTDITLDPNSLDIDGSGIYVNVDDDLPVTGSGNQELVGRVAPLDGFTVYGSTFPDSGSVVWKSNAVENTTPIREQIILGNNQVDFTSNNTTAIGNNNEIKQNTNIVNVQGVSNKVEDSAQYINVTGDNNLIEANTRKSSILNSTTSSIKNNTSLSTIIGGENTIISGSNKSVAIGQDTVTIGGNSNIVIGNYDTNTRTIKEMINTVVINPNRDVETIENLNGEDLNGHAFLGTYKEIGGHFSDSKTITASAGSTIYLTGSEYANDSIYNLTWTGGDGICQIYLPEVTKNPVVLRDSQGFKRYLRFTTDGTFDAGKNAGINVAAGDYLNGTFNGSYNLDASYQNFEIFGVSESYWRVLEAGVPDTTNGGHTGAYGSFYSTSSQAIVTPGTSQLVTFNGTLSSNKIALSGSGAIQMEYNGAYKLTYTAQLTNIDNAYHYANFWIKYNGVDYPNSTVRVSAPPRKSATEPSSTAVTVGLLDVAQNDFDKIELYWQGDSTNLSLEYVSGAGIPDAPSIFAQINAV